MNITASLQCFIANKCGKMASLSDFDEGEETDPFENSSDDEDYVPEVPSSQSDFSEPSDAEYTEEEEEVDALGDERQQQQVRESAAVNPNLLLMSKNKEIQYCVDSLPQLPHRTSQSFALNVNEGEQYAFLQ